MVVLPLHTDEHSDEIRTELFHGGARWVAVHRGAPTDFVMEVEVEGPALSTVTVHDEINNTEHRFRFPTLLAVGDPKFVTDRIDKVLRAPFN